MRITEQMRELREKVKRGEVILFLGAGVPATLGLPSWNQLIDSVAVQMGFDPELFHLYGNNLSLAEYYRLHKKNNIGLSDWMKTEWNVDDSIISHSKIYSMIVNSGCNLIYTTNYDHTLERAFELAAEKHSSSHTYDYSKIVVINDIAVAKGVQIVKFHGDYDLPESMVLAESDYYERLNFESPLDIKLRSDMLTKSILFLGYSLSDINIRLLSYKLFELWKKSPLPTERPKSYIFLSKPNPVEEKIFEDRGVLPIVGDRVDRTKGLEEFLEYIFS